MDSFQNEKELLADTIRRKIEEKIRELNEERYKADTEFAEIPCKNSFVDDFDRKRKSFYASSIVHGLNDEEIRNDVNFIRYCLSQKNNLFHFDHPSNSFKFANPSY